MTTQTRVITWNTTKTAEGFAWSVYSFGYQLANETLKTGVCRSRAQATNRAKKWTRFLKSQQRAEAA